MDVLRSGARLLSRGMRSGSGALTLIGGLLVARGILRWLDGPEEERVFSRRLVPGQRLEVVVTRLDD